MSKGLLAFAVLVTAGLTLILGNPANSQRRSADLDPIVISKGQTEVVSLADTLKSGEVLATVLARQSLSPPQVAEAVSVLSDYADLRRLRAGLQLQVRRTAWDSLLDITIRIDPDHEVRLTPDGPGWLGELSALAFTVDTVLIAGHIESSLYNSIMALPLPSIGAEERIERLMWGIYGPFQWAIDFGIDIREGDSYRAVYERHVRADGSVRQARVLAAQFINRGKTHRAFWFNPREEYYDDEGGSMKRVFLKAPVDFRRISSRFSRNRHHPKLGINRAHLGTDYAAATGTSVYSTANGTVTRAGWWGGFGRAIEVRHANGYRTRYAHLSAIASGIKEGVRVKQAQVIGRVGSSGVATGPHLHYEMLRNGKAIDPRTVNLPSGNPVPQSELASFLSTRERLSAMLERDREAANRVVD